MRKLLQKIRSTKGVTLIEYGLIAALIAVAAIAMLKNVGTNVKGTFSNVYTNLS